MSYNLLSTYTINELFAIFLVFCRVGAALMLVPGIGEIYVSPRIRLLLALLMSLVLSMGLRPLLPPAPDSALVLALLLSAEIMIGVFLGLMVRIMLAALHTAGMIISMQSSLATAMMFDTSQSTQGSTFGIFLNLTALLLFFATDLHHTMLIGFADSYTLFTAGAFTPVDDMAMYLAELFSKSFAIAFKLAAPVMVMALLIYLGAGVLARLMPAIQVFFVIIPLQILISILIFTITLSSVLLWYFDYLEQNLMGFVR